ncbi:MAG: NFACT RNA binding domain-containing protein [Cyclobacteriaceae bacterium]
MFSNYYFLKRLAPALQQRIDGLTVVELFSQNKEELIIGLAGENEEFWIRANLDPNISLLSFPESFSRARQNSVNLFSYLIGKVVTECTVFSYERSFQISFGETLSLIFKMHGRRANILLMNNGEVKDLFRKNLSSDLELTPDQLNRSITINESNFIDHGYEPKSLIPALGKEVQSWWDTRYSTMENKAKWSAFSQLLEKLESNKIALIDGDSPTISLLDHDDLSATCTDPIEATNWLYEKKTRSFYLDRGKNQLLANLKQQIKKSENYIFKTSEKLRLVDGQRSPEEIANILMANLNLIERGQSKVTLSDFYNNGLIEIKLNPKLTPQKNAENLYRKSKNRHQEIEKLKQNIIDKEKVIEKLSLEILEVEGIENTQELKNHHKSDTSRTTKNQKEKPYHEFELDSWIIMVGKNAKANDELTLKVATKNDLWLHAKDVSGSHVVIRQKPGQNFPKHIIEYAASLAALNSKRKTDSVCPVIFTPKKYVRKSKGALPGQVIVEKEEVVLVSPAAL